MVGRQRGPGVDGEKGFVGLHIVAQLQQIGAGVLEARLGDLLVGGQRHREAGAHDTLGEVFEAQVSHLVARALDVLVDDVRATQREVDSGLAQ
eukprot:2290654-Prymnesium_polylepis.2